jgi:hypothetical protein
MSNAPACALRLATRPQEARRAAEQAPARRRDLDRGLPDPHDFEPDHWVAARQYWPGPAHVCARDHRGLSLCA